MQKPIGWLVLVAVWLGALRVEGANSDFEDLFNGRDFTGWRFSLQKTGDPWPDNWKIKDSVICLSGLMKPNLVTTRAFTDFEMKFEWRALTQKFNGGFYIRSKQDTGNNQIRIDRNYEGAFLAGNLNGAKPVPLLQRPIGEWNEWRVIVKGATITLHCNGKLAWEATGLAPDSGYIGLQAEGSPMEFRNLRVREIK